MNKDIKMELCVIIKNSYKAFKDYYGSEIVNYGTDIVMRKEHRDALIKYYEVYGESELLEKLKDSKPQGEAQVYCIFVPFETMITLLNDFPYRLEKEWLEERGVEK